MDVCAVRILYYGCVLSQHVAYRPLSLVLKPRWLCLLWFSLVGSATGWDSLGSGIVVEAKLVVFLVCRCSMLCSGDVESVMEFI